MVTIREYVREDGQSPFASWFQSLDVHAALRMTVALERITHGHTSAMKALGEGVAEYKIDYGPAYRIYFGGEGEQLIILVGGGTKKRQGTDIAEAKAIWREYKRRKR